MGRIKGVRYIFGGELKVSGTFSSRIGGYGNSEDALTFYGPKLSMVSRFVVNATRGLKAAVHGPNPFGRRPIGGFLRKESQLEASPS